jgi:hypothetical protein
VHAAASDLNLTFAVLASSWSPKTRRPLTVDQSTLSVALRIEGLADADPDKVEADHETHARDGAIDSVPPSIVGRIAVRNPSGYDLRVIGSFANKGLQHFFFALALLGYRQLTRSVYG